VAKSAKSIKHGGEKAAKIEKALSGVAGGGASWRKSWRQQWRRQRHKKMAAAWRISEKAGICRQRNAIAQGVGKKGEKQRLVKGGGGGDMAKA
jgi:hypothetical protein